jgi:hypothetical protein
MVVRTATIVGTKEIVHTAAVMKRRIDFEATVSLNDTVVIADIATLLNAAIFKKADGAAITCTVATNVITVTGASTDAAIIGVAYGTP